MTEKTPPSEPDFEWFVLLIGGPSAVGKTMIAAQVARRLGAPWLMVDDLRLALERSGVPVPDADAIEAYDGPGGLVALGEFMAPAIEVVIENHVEQRIPMVIEGDGILPSLFDRPSVRARAVGGRVRAVFLSEPDESALHANFRARSAESRHLAWQDSAIRAHVHKNSLYGQWLEREARRSGLPIVPARPWNTLVGRILVAADLSAAG